MRTTLGFVQVGLDIVTSANCKSQLQFQRTNIYQLLYLTSSTYFQSATVWADGILIPNLHKALNRWLPFYMNRFNYKMYVPNYKDTEGKLALIIFDLARGEQEVKKRLVNVFIERGTLMKDDFPKELQDEWNYIIDFMTSKPKNSYKSSYKNSLKNKRNKTCSVIVGKITLLYEQIKKHNLITDL